MNLLQFSHYTWLLLLLHRGFADDSKTEKHYRPPLVDQLMKNYEQIPPKGSTKVEIGIYINSIYAISEQTMDYSLSIYLRQQWHDERFLFDPRDNRNKTKIKMEDNIWTDVWTPDLFFRNEKKASFHSVTTPNRLMFVHSTGRVWYVTKITTTLTCPMKLKKYPLDTQECPMTFESFGYTMDTLVLGWLPSPVEFDPSMELPQYRFMPSKFSLINCSQEYIAGSYPCLEIRFHIQRNVGYYMIQLYVPSVLIVILSCVSFWLNVDAAPARVSIGLLTVLATTFMSTGAREQLPRVSYITAIDVWMSACLVFVFVSLLEYAVVSVYARKQYPWSNQTTTNVTTNVTTIPPTTTGTTITTTKSVTAISSTTTVPAITSKSIVTASVTERASVSLYSSQLRLQSKSDQCIDVTNRSSCVSNGDDIPVEMVQVTSPAERVRHQPRYENSQNGRIEIQEGRHRARRVDQISRRLFPAIFSIFSFIYWLLYWFIL